MRGLNFKGKIQWDKLRIPLLLALIVALALFLRIYWAIGPSIQQGFAVSGGSDSYYHEKIIQYILNSRHQLLEDPMLNYPIGVNNPRPPLFHWAIVISSFVFYPFMSPYDSAVLMLILFPAIWGSLTVIPVYLLGKEAFNRKVGLLAAFFLAILPADLMRSVATQADWDAFNLFFIVLSFYFFLRALKTTRYKYWIRDWFNRNSVKTGLREFFKDNTEATIYAALSGLSLGTVALAWKGFTYALAILVIYLFVQVFINRFRNKSNLHMVVYMAAYMIMAFGISFPWYYVTNRLGQWFFVPLFLIAGVWVIGLILEITGKYPWPLVFGVSALIIAGALSVINVFFPDLWMLIVEGQGYFVKSKLYSTIAEAQPASLGYLAMSFGVAIFILSFLGLAYMLYLIKKEKEEYYLFFVFYTIIAIYMAISAARFIFNASPAFALAGAVGTIWLVDILKFRETFEEVRRYQGSWRKKMRAALKFSQVTFVLVLAFLIITPTVWSAVDAGIPYESKRKLDKQIYNSMPSFLRPNETTYNRSAPWYLGAFGFSVPKETYPWPRAWRWLSEQDNSSPPADRPAFVSWWDYGFESVQEGKHPAVADNFQNGYQMAAQIITAQNESEVISLFIIRMMEGDYAHHGKSFSPGMLDILNRYFSPEDVEKIKEAMANPGKFREEVLDNPDYYGYYESDISDTNTKYAYLKGLFAHHREDFLVKLYDDVRNYTGYDIRYFAVDYRLFPFSGRNTGIFYAPAKLGDRRIHEYGGTVVPYDFYDLKAVDQYGNEYELDKVPANVHITDYKIYYKPMFYHSMLYRTFIGYSGKDVDAGDGIPGISPNLYNYYPMQAWNLTHFKLVYRTAYWNPYKDYQNHTKDWKPIPIDLALKYQREGKGTVELNPPAYQVLPNDVVMVKFYEGAIIEGTVRLDTGEPVKHVRVTLQDEYHIPHVSVFTDDNGHFRIPAVAGNLTLIVSTNGRLNKLNMVEQTVLYRTTINVSEEQAMRLKPDFVIHRDITVDHASVNGVVYLDVDHNGKLSDKDIRVNGFITIRNSTYGFNTTVAVKDGAYSISNLPPHRYAVDVEISGKVFAAVDNITLSAGQNLTKDIILKPSSIRGNVTFSNGTPAANATVDIRGEFAKYTVRTDENGSFVVYLIPDNYTLVASYGDYVSDKQDISVKTWAYNTSVNITLKHAFTLTGRLTYGGIPMTGVPVKITSELLPHTVYIVKTGRDGKFTVRLPGGIYSVYTTTFSGSERLVYLSVVNLGSDKTLDMHLRKAYRISGRVVSKDNLTAVEVGFYHGDTFYRAFANNTGYFEAYLPEGRYNIGVVAFNLTNAPYFGRATVDLNEDRYVEITAHRGYNVTGIAYFDRNGNGAVDENETIYNGLVALQDSEGIYEIRNIPPSGKFTLVTTTNYVVKAIAWGYRESDIYTGKEIKVKMTPAEVTLRGEVKYEGRANEIEVNMLFVKSDDPAKRYALYGVTSSYTISLPPGNYTISLFGYDRSYEVQGNSVRLPLGFEEVRHDISFTASAHVEVITQATAVRWFSDGEPVASGKVVDLPIGEYTIYAHNDTHAAIMHVSIEGNATIEVPLQRGYLVVFNVVNYTTVANVHIYAGDSHITESETALLPAGKYTFVVNDTKVEEGLPYRYFAESSAMITEDSTVTLNVVREKVVSEVTGRVTYDGIGGLSNCVVHFIGIGDLARNVTVVTDASGNYRAKLVPGEYMVYTYYILGHGMYANITFIDADSSMPLDIHMERGYLLSGETYMRGEKVSTVVHVHRGKGRIDVLSTGYYWIVLPRGNYTISAEEHRREYGMDITYRAEDQVVVTGDASHDLYLERVTNHYLDVEVISSDRLVSPNSTLGITLRVRNFGNIEEKVSFEGLGAWTLVNPPNYTLMPGEERIAYLKMRVPYNAKAGSHSVQVRIIYSGYTKDVTAYTNVTAVYATKMSYEVRGWNNQTLVMSVKISNTGNVWANYTLSVLNREELKAHGWSVRILVDGREANWVNISFKSEKSVTIQATPTRAVPSTSIPIVFEAYSDRSHIIEIPLTNPQVSQTALYIQGDNVQNYSGVKIEEYAYWVWGASAALAVAIIYLGRYRK